LIFASVFALGQKFMIQGKDTLPYKEKMVIQKDTTYFGKKTYYPGDTLYEGACRTFEKINGQIVNQTDSLCLSRGLWIIPDSLGNYWRGVFEDSKEVGVWQWLNKNKKLLKETEEVHLDKDTYRIKEIDYSSGHPIIVINKPFLGFYIKNFFIIMPVIFLAFFIRVFVNSWIYNNENGTDYSVIYFHAPGYVSKNFYHSLMCTFTFWFFKYRPENKRLVIISHILSVIAIGAFLSILIGLAISGDL
jgi:hypothetical protein